ncbi:MAG: hypothetical protein CMJ89_00470 [Planctomycetes bacterium]|nr:hypothetical protein [Planctomycetota bacterium]
MIWFARVSCVLALLVSVLPAQGHHVFVMDSGSAITYSGQMQIPLFGSQPITGQPANQFNVEGTAGVDITAVGGVPIAGQLVSGGVAGPTGPINAVVQVPFFGTLASIAITGVTLDVTSAPFNINQGAFTTMAQVNLLTGAAVVTALGSTTNIALGGQQTPPSMLSGTVTTVPGGYAASIPLNNVTFTFTDPASGLGGNLTLAGSFNSTYRPLNSATQGVSVSTGGVQTLQLSTGGSFGGDQYLVLASGSGTSPGLAIGGGLVLPLNFDNWFLQSYQSPNVLPFGNTGGALDSMGRAVATITVPTGLPPSVAGLSFDFAYATAGSSGYGMVSNPFPLVLLP